MKNFETPEDENTTMDDIAEIFIFISICYSNMPFLSKITTWWGALFVVMAPQPIFAGIGIFLIIVSFILGFAQAKDKGMFS